MLTAWGQEPAVSGSGGTDHGFMDHGPGVSGTMSEQDIAALQDAQDPEADRLYPEQVTAHHRGAVGMARQEAGIARMDQLLQELPGQS